MEYLINQKLEDNKYLIYSLKQDKQKVINHDEYTNIKIAKYYKLDCDIEDIKEYALKFEEWRINLLDEGIDILKSNNLYYLVTDIYFKFCDKIKSFPKITYKEYKWFSKCNNSSMIYFDESYKDTPIKSYAYDYKNFYGKILSSDSFKIPISKGYESSITELPTIIKDIKYGIYNIKITCDNDDFKKVFLFSKDNCYTHITLKYCLMLKDKYNIKFEIIEGINCLLYDETVSGKLLFGKHYDELSRIKAKYPENKLVKHLLSSLWGHLTTKNKKNISAEELMDIDYCTDIKDSAEYLLLDHKVFYVNREYNEYFTVLKTNDIYKYNIRLVPFLQSFSRNKIGTLAQESINDVVRVQTDCCIFTKEMVFTKPYLDLNTIVKEEKSSGRIKWRDVNYYSKKCKTCKQWVQVSKMQSHIC
jgi:hypothetical protein